MCGIVGISAETNIAAEIYDSLLMLQHRGQDAAGMVVCDSQDRLHSRKSMGYVRDVFQQRHMSKLIGNYGIGHVRYPTAGGAGKEFAQPMYVNSPYGISIAHNGNLTNSKELATQLFHAEMRHLNTDSDSEVLLNIKKNPDHDIDVVIPIPDSSTTAALQLAVDLNVPYREGFVKNRYIGRTFIMPYQEERRKSVRRKLNILDLEFEGKNVMLVDDSIVRGTTSKKIIEMAKEAGAKKVYFASAAPAIKYQNLYGIDMPATSELIASNRTDEEVATEIGADWLVYQTLEDLMLGENYLKDLEISRQDEVKAQREKAKA
ncbi:MAG: hypothetical protein EBW62_00290 [Proteobacteria bacterium]|nr:hypothetical protein [Pseudomonadota bacterium]